MSIGSPSNYPEKIEKSREPELRVEGELFQKRLAEVLGEDVDGKNELEVRHALDQVEEAARTDYDTVVVAKQVHRSLSLNLNSLVKLGNGPDITGILLRAEETRKLKSTLGKTRTTALPWYEFNEGETNH